MVFGVSNIKCMIIKPEFQDGITVSCIVSIAHLLFNTFVLRPCLLHFDDEDGLHSTNNLDAKAMGLSTPDGNRWHSLACNPWSHAFVDNVVMHNNLLHRGKNRDLGRWLAVAEKQLNELRRLAAEDTRLSHPDVFMRGQLLPVAYCLLYVLYAIRYACECMERSAQASLDI
ncbi:hypothetical protein T4A_1982 [Trichinella pseudospiralis]|uniref:Uncharacterized protein n=1 Tax=Trichinella pseudospiralis TaxID=6337 RepID=A0A0V1EE57_TRIPS|nr:hypothetical protein T4A_1982 [Trichinella pseudospiralis]